MGTIISLELGMNPDGTNGSLMLLYPDHSPLLIAKELSGKYVWFALSDNCNAPDFMDHTMIVISVNSNVNHKIRLNHII